MGVQEPGRPRHRSRIGLFAKALALCWMIFSRQKYQEDKPFRVEID